MIRTTAKQASNRNPISAECGFERVRRPTNWTVRGEQPAASHTVDRPPRTNPIELQPIPRTGVLRQQGALRQDCHVEASQGHASLLTPAVKAAPSRAPSRHPRPQVIIRGGEDGPDPRPAHETRRFGPSRTIGPDGGADRSNVKPRHHCPPPSASQKWRGELC
ncbi:hypothetical protein CMUS01_06393 [Colletotrichum musicola]|uniref:Uncharacterized protein n=1 Tax=Colletotrichum musicola TaxID=2175873 RepID=A0A8H6KMY7_9PEZI|nr:hypothetical protein CMUS01_06393 [Colletotrichum musicola]